MILEELVSIWRFRADDSDLGGVAHSIDMIQTSMFALTQVTAVASGAIGSLISMAGQREQVQIGFETMLGDAEKAKKLMKEIIAFADVTPFLTSEVVMASRQLLAAKVPTEEIIDKVRMLGDVAAGAGANIQDMVRLYSQIYLQKGTRVPGEKIKQFSMAGVPIFPELTKQFGGSNKKMWAALDQGKIKFENIDKALKGMTKKGGLYFELMLKQSKSFLGLVSTIMGKLNDFAKEIGGEFLPMAKSMALLGLNWFNLNKAIVKSQIVSTVKALNEMIFNSVKIFSAFSHVVVMIGKYVGGLEVILKSFTGFILFSLIIGIGKFVSSAFFAITTMKIFGATVSLVHLWMNAFWVSMGGLTIFLALAFQDFIVWIKGGKAALGDAFDKLFKSKQKVIQFFNNIGKAIRDIVDRPITFFRRAVENIPIILEKSFYLSLRFLRKLPHLIFIVVVKMIRAFKKFTEGLDTKEVLLLIYNIRKFFVNLKELKDDVTDTSFWSNPLWILKELYDLKKSAKMISLLAGNLKVAQAENQILPTKLGKSLAQDSQSVWLRDRINKQKQEATINLNVKGMEPETAKEVATEAVNRTLSSQFREAQRDGAPIAEN